jgi:hypothetical protein
MRSYCAVNLLLNMSRQFAPTSRVHYTPHASGSKQDSDAGAGGPTLARNPREVAGGRWPGYSSSLAV